MSEEINVEPTVTDINDVDAEVLVDETTPEEPAVVEPITVEEAASDNVVVVDAEDSSVEPEVKALAPIQNGVIGSTTKKKATPKADKSAKAEATVKEEKVAIHSTKNVSWQGVGKVSKGYNFVSVKDAEKWATRDHIRLVDPTEIARELK